MKKVEHVCYSCEGDRVTKDAWAEWSIEEQKWILESVFDDAYCHDCEAETRLIEVEIKDEPVRSVS